MQLQFLEGLRWATAAKKDHELHSYAVFGVDTIGQKNLEDYVLQNKLIQEQKIC